MRRADGMFCEFGNLTRDLSGSARNGHTTLKIVRYSRARLQPLYMNIRVAVRIVAVLAITAAITFLCFHLVPVNATTAGFTYLIAILLIATAWGLLEAMVAERRGLAPRPLRE